MPCLLGDRGCVSLQVFQCPQDQVLSVQSSAGIQAESGAGPQPRALLQTRHVVEPVKGMDWSPEQALRGQMNQGEVYIHTMQLLRVESSGAHKEAEGKAGLSGPLQTPSVYTNQGSKRYKEPAVGHTPEIPALQKLGQENLEFEGSVDYRMRPCLRKKK